MARGSGDSGWVIWEFLHSRVSCIDQDVSKSGFSWTYHPEGPTHGFSVAFKLLTGLWLLTEREILSDSASMTFNGLVFLRSPIASLLSSVGPSRHKSALIQLKGMLKSETGGSEMLPTCYKNKPKVISVYRPHVDFQQAETHSSKAGPCQTRIFMTQWFFKCNPSKQIF